MTEHSRSSTEVSRILQESLEALAELQRGLAEHHTSRPLVAWFAFTSIEGLVAPHESLDAAPGLAASTELQLKGGERHESWTLDLSGGPAVTIEAYRMPDDTLRVSLSPPLEGIHVAFMGTSDAGVVREIASSITAISGYVDFAPFADILVLEPGALFGLEVTIPPGSAPLA